TDPRVRAALRLVAPLQPARLSVAPRAACARCSAGAIPNNRPVTSDAPRANATRRQSRSDDHTGDAAKSFTRGRSPGLIATSALAPQTPAMTPAMAPTVDSKSDSIR